MIHLYEGDGKGKTSAAIGLCIRSLGNNHRVVFAQFLKGRKSGEIEFFNQYDLPNLSVYRMEKDYGFYKDFTKEQLEQVRNYNDEMLDAIRKECIEQEIHLVVLDEITYPYAFDLIDQKKLRDFIIAVKEQTEIVFTGRNPDSFFVELADYHTEMKMHKHPYEQKIPARKGIEF